MDPETFIAVSSWVNTTLLAGVPLGSWPLPLWRRRSGLGPTNSALHWDSCFHADDSAVVFSTPDQPDRFGEHVTMEQSAARRGPIFAEGLQAEAVPEV